VRAHKYLKPGPSLQLLSFSYHKHSDASSVGDVSVSMHPVCAGIFSTTTQQTGTCMDTLYHPVNAAGQQLHTKQSARNAEAAAAKQKQLPPCSRTQYVAALSGWCPLWHPVSACRPCCAEGGHVYPNDGAAYFKARFRLVVFRPFVGEVLVGTLTACTK